MGQGKLMSFHAGASIFRQGEQGGDLYFIKSGEVEVFIERGGKEVSLDRLRAGEVLGTMTLLNRESRMASARAATDSELMMVPSDSIQKLVVSLPEWLRAVLKDYTLRIQHMDRLYVDAVVEKDKLRESARTPMSVVRSIGAGIVALAEFGGGTVETAKAFRVIAATLGVSEKEVEEFAGTLGKAGLLGNDGAKSIALADLDDLRYVIDQLAESRGKKRKPLPYVSVTDQKVLFALCAFAKTSVTGDQEARIPFKDASEGVEKQSKRKLEEEVIERADGVGILQYDRSVEPNVLVFKPKELARQLAMMAVVRKIEFKEEAED